MRLTVLALIADLTAATNALAGQGYTCTPSQTYPPAPVILVTVVPDSGPMPPEPLRLTGSDASVAAPRAADTGNLLHVVRDGQRHIDTGDYWLDLHTMQLKYRAHGTTRVLGDCAEYPNY